MYYEERKIKIFFSIFIISAIFGAILFAQRLLNFDLAVLYQETGELTKLSSSFIASAFTTILAYILHSKITWKERNPGKTGIYKFLIWNLLLTIAINPGFTQLFSLFTPLYELAFNIFQAIHIPFSYEFIQSTGAFVLTAIVTMILNFLFYDRFVFGKKKL